MAEHKRKLAAIVFTDIVGFTKITADDQTLATSLLDTQRDLLKPIVEAHNGKWLKEMGDGLILIFDTVTDAVNGCIKIQEAARNVEHLNLRIGMHEGEILLMENDVIGDDVNIASRIEAFSAPGGIAISNKVNDAIARESHFTTKYLGKPKLKGVGQNVEVYCINSHGLPETNMSEVSAKLEKSSTFVYVSAGLALCLFIFLYLFLTKQESVESIAVLYMDVGSNSELNYLETITEDLIFDLASTSQGLLKVSETGKVKKFKNTDKSLDELASEIGVNYVFQSSIQKDDNGYNLRCRLYDSNQEKDRFINKWFIESKNLQTIVGVLAENIIKELDIEASSEFKRLEFDPEAYELYLQAKSIYALSSNQEDNLKAIDMMEKAILKDENLVMAQIYMGTMQDEQGNFEEASRYYSKALTKGKILQDNATIAEALRKQGTLLRKNKEFDKAVAKFSEALSISTILNDKYSMAKSLNSVAISYYQSGDKDNALKNWLQALSIAEELGDKGAISKRLNNIGIWYWKDQDYSKSIEYYQKSIAIKQELGDKRNIGKTLNNLGKIYFSMGDYKNAVVQYDKSIETKKELGDNKGLHSSMFNKGQAYFYLDEFNKSISEFRQSMALQNSDFYMNEKYRYIGMCHYYLGNYDSSNVYLSRSSRFFKEDSIKLLSIIPFQILTDIKTKNKTDIKPNLELFKQIISEKDPYPSDYVLTNWAMYEVLINLGSASDASEYLENAYFELKARSKSIKDKKGRNKFLQTKLHKNIASAWKEK